jgi:hypothetical protein
VTIKSLGKGRAGFGLYNAALKKSVAVSQESAKPATAVAFKGAVETFGDVWSYVFAFDQFEKGSIKYSSKTLTYTLRGTSGQTATIKLNSQGRISEVSTTGILASRYTFAYSTDKSLWAKWGNFGPKTQALIAWMIGAKYQVFGAKQVFTKTKTGLKVTGDKGYSAEFNTSGMSASTVSAVFKQLGYVLK